MRILAISADRSERTIASLLASLFALALSAGFAVSIRFQKPRYFTTWSAAIYTAVFATLAFSIFARVWNRLVLYLYVPAFGLSWSIPAMICFVLESDYDRIVEDLSETDREPAKVLLQHSLAHFSPAFFLFAFYVLYVDRFDEALSRPGLNPVEYALLSACVTASAAATYLLFYDAERVYGERAVGFATLLLGLSFSAAFPLIASGGARSRLKRSPSAPPLTLEQLCGRKTKSALDI